MAFIDTRKLTLITLLAAVYALGTLLPGFKVISLPSAEIDIVRCLEMGYGFILGPIYGPITAFLGAIVGKISTGEISGLYFTPLAPLSAFMAAAISRRRIFKIKGWIIASIILSALIIIWYVIPTGIAVPIYPVLHFIALLFILIFRDKLVEYLRSDDRKELSLGVAVGSFSSTMAAQMLGNFIFIALFSPPPVVFLTSLPVAAIERLIITILSTIIVTPIIILLRTIYPELFIET
jgi:hypothetical protein